MNNKINKQKWLTVCLLPIIWLFYFLCEIITGRVNDFYTFIMNLLLTIIFAITGLLIYNISKRYSNGFSSKVVFIIFIILILIDQGTKIVIKSFFFKYSSEIHRA